MFCCFFFVSRTYTTELKRHITSHRRCVYFHFSEPPFAFVCLDLGLSLSRLTQIWFAYVNMIITWTTWNIWMCFLYPMRLLFFVWTFLCGFCENSDESPIEIWKQIDTYATQLNFHLPAVRDWSSVFDICHQFIDECLEKFQILIWTQIIWNITAMHASLWYRFNKLCIVNYDYAVVKGESKKKQAAAQCSTRTASPSINMHSINSRR